MCVCVCVCVCLQSLAMQINLFRTYAPFCHRHFCHTPTATPSFASWPKKLISCALAHEQPFH